MRKIVIASLALAAACMATVDEGNAQTRRWCTQGRVGGWGFPNCAYDTLQQCQAAASGNGRSCTQNFQYEQPGKSRKKKPEH